MTPEEEPQPLKGDPRRQAVASLRGYEYQIWHTVHDWLDLREHEAIFVEGAEDFDKVSRDAATATQVKDTRSKITLRTPSVIEAIVHYWELQKSHAGRRINFRYLTRSEIAVEAGEPFGKEMAGLELWKQCPNRPELVVKLASFLLSEKKLPGDLIAFLRAAETQEILGKLIIPIVWETNSDAVEVVELAIDRKLILHGDSRNPQVPPSKAKKVSDRLLREVFSIAKKKTNRRLDYAFFLEIFEGETSELVSHQELTLLRSQATAMGQQISSFPFGEKTVFQMEGPKITDIPPVHFSVALRCEVTGRLLDLLKKFGVLVLTGSTGMGKTTLAKLIAEKSGRNWKWVTFSNVGALEYGHEFKALAALVEQREGSDCLILDDVNLLPEHSRQLEEYFAGILYTILQRKGYLILTSQKELSVRLAQSINLKEESTQAVPVLTYSEIADFAVQLGCQDGNDAKAWAAITLIHTSGHAQLVHAQMKNLMQMGWPKPVFEKALEQPVEISKTLRDARLLLQSLPEDHRELLYRLSIVPGLFRRDHVIAVGEIKPKVPFVGDVCDRLVGPWIEYVDHGYLRVSPLLKNCASSVWSESEIRNWHEVIGFSILKCSPRTPVEASTVLMQGILGRSAGLVSITANSILSGDHKLMKAAAESLSWLQLLTKGSNGIFPEHKWVNFMLRLLQFKVAAELNPETRAPEVIAAWEQDPMPDSPPEIAKCSRFLYLGSLIYHIKVPISPRKLIQAIAEMADLMGGFSPLMKAFGSMAKESATDPIGTAFLVTLARPASVGFLEELLDVMEEDWVAKHLERMLESLRVNEVMTRMFIDAVWFEESKKESPDWPNCIRVLEKCIDFATHRKIPELKYSSARAIAIVQDEYLCNEDLALAALNRWGPSDGKLSVTIENQRATILFHLEDYGSALVAWERILPVWSARSDQYDTSVLFGFNKAGRSAALLGDWKKAASLFQGAASLAEKLGQHAHAMGFKLDVAWALWKAGDWRDSFQIFSQCFTALEALAAGSGGFYEVKIRRILGHLLICLKREIEQEDYGDLSDLPPGVASDPNASDKWREANFPFCIIFFAQIEFYLQLEPKFHHRARNLLTKAPTLLMRSEMAELELRIAFHKSLLEDFPRLGFELEQAYLIANKYRMDNRSVLNEPVVWDLRLETQSSGESLMPTLLTHALVVSLANDCFSMQLFNQWGASVAEVKGYTWLLEWLRVAERIFSIEPNEAAQMMIDQSLSVDLRYVAAVRLMKDSDGGVNEMFNAQIWVLSWASQSKMPWGYDLGCQVARIVESAWRKQCQSRAVLRSPSLAVPEILAACDNPAVGIAKAAKILSAAANAVSIRVANDFMNHIKGIESLEITNPYRFSMQK